MACAYSKAKISFSTQSTINPRKSKKVVRKLSESEIVVITIEGEIFQGIWLDLGFMWLFWSQIGNIADIAPIEKEVVQDKYMPF